MSESLSSLNLPPGIDVPSKRDMTRDEFTRAEQIIGRGKQTFIEVGEALTDIRDRKGWRFGYKSFDDYCKKKWHWTAGRARQLIGATEVALDIKSVTTGNALPNGLEINERQARDLKQMPREEVIAKLQPALESRDPKAVDDAVHEITYEHREEKKAEPPGVHYAKHEDAAPDLDEAFDATVHENAKPPPKANFHRSCPACGADLYFDRFVNIVRALGRPKE